MNIEMKHNIALVREPGVLITDGSSAMDLLATARYETGCSAMVLRKEQIDESFFRLSTGLAGEVLQKFVNYQMKLAIVGDFSAYTSKPLQDFIRESNEGRQICFQPDEASALSWLERG
ncbi:MAG: DUF4180 domain-containing protein [Oscillospiraceae bacterium]|jgi:hypothetical protein|nr:DUF4180 domain-containing protein [Oscillospiraceae bacterium]